MENNLIALAKTVAQISVELKSIKSVEDVIKNLTRDVQELQKLNLGSLDSNSSVKQSEMYRSTSEPRQFVALQNKEELTSYESNHRRSSPNENKENNDTKRKYGRETIRLPTYTNPRKLKKLTK